VRAYEGQFADAKESDWFHNDVSFVYERGLMAGATDTGFSPLEDASRGMVAAIWGRLANADALGLEPPFSDVDPSAYYAPYVAWAAASGISAGVGGGRSEPDRAIKRQELAVFIHKFVERMGLELPEANAYAPFKDEAEIAGYAKESVRFCYKAGIILGRTGGVFDPEGAATRAEVAAMLRRLITAANIG
jgi:hypothetical protein